ncbi:MAG: hypothetical protein ABJC26_10765 [Gemmatimonadaceae bacterium]
MTFLAPIRTFLHRFRSALTCAVLCGFAAFAPHAANAQATGVLTVLWGDPIPGSTAPSKVELWLNEDGGRMTRVYATDVIVSRAGGIMALNKTRVTVSGVRQPDAIRAGADEINASIISPVRQLVKQLPTANLLAPGSKPFITILCKFADVPGEPTTPSNVTTLISGPAYPSIDHYYRELSNNQIDLGGSNVVGWFTLPQPRSYYVNSSLNFTALTNDCTAAADTTVNFSQYYGINMQFNEDLDGSAWGGTRYLALDGVAKYFGVTWMPLWATQASKYGVYAHEMGHSFGWPHSSGPYANTYDSKWDVMSNSYLLYYTPLASYIAGHTIVRNKDAAGWIPAGRKVTVPSGGVQTISLDAHEFPSASTGALMVQVPIAGTSDYYTIESRLQTGYDIPLPGSAVIIHKITAGYARVVDPDNNGDPNDAGAQWIAGETFTDAANGIVVNVDTKTTTGWNIRVANGSLTCTLTLSAATGGTASITSGGAVGACGRSVTIQANPSVSFGFANFTEDGAAISIANPFTFVLNKDRTIVANFGVAQCTLTLSQASGGTATLINGTATGACGRSVTVQAVPITNFGFVKWSDGSTATPYSFAVTTAMTLTPTYAALQCALTLNASAGGTATVSSGGATGNCGRTVTIQATPNANFGFANFTEGTTTLSVSSPYTLVLNSSRIIVANFLTSQCTLTLNAANGGTVSVTSGSTAGACGRSITVQATPDPYSTFSAWSDASVANPRTLTITSSQTLTASFTTRQCTLTLNADVGGSATIASGGATGDCGRSITIQATALSGYGFTSFTESGALVSSSSPVTFALMADRTITANFFVSQCTLTLNGSANGTLNVANGTVAGTCGRSVTVSATPNSSYSFGTWSDGATINPYTFVINNNKTLSATFISLQCALTLNAGLGGTVAVTAGSAGGACGRQVTLQATADKNYVFVNFTENGAVLSNANPFATIMAANRTLVANFAIAQCNLYFYNQVEGGTAALTSGSETGNCGRSITVKAFPNANYTFSSWSDGSRENPHTLELSTDVDLEPLFIAVQCKLTLNQVNGGTAAITAGSATGACGRSITVTATPANSNSTFTSWSNGTTANPLTITLNNDATLAPSFAGVLCTLTLGTVTGGSVSIASGNTAGPCGRTITLQAAPSANYTFTAWSDGTTTNPYSVTLNTDLTISPTFVAQQCALSLSAGAGGVVTLVSGTAAGDCGRTISVQASPNATFSFINWTEGGSELSTTSLYSFTLTRNLNVAANFLLVVQFNKQDIVNRLLSGFVGGTLTFSAAERQYIDDQGNANGSVDLGDLLALVQKNPSIVAGPEAMLKILANPKASALRVPVKDKPL